MNYLLTNPEPFIMKMIVLKDGVFESAWRKDIRGLKYPAPAVAFVGPFKIVETCPDSGLQVVKELS